jgi:hypothetical protein
MTKHDKILSSIFKHIAKGGNANNTFAKSLKKSLFNKRQTALQSYIELVVQHPA